MKSPIRRAPSEALFDIVANNAVFVPIFRRFLEMQSNPRAAQESLFQKRKQELAGTEVSKLLGLEKANSYADYLHNVPAHDYSFFDPLVKRAVAGEKNILFRDSLDFLCVTSGTSGFNSKVIPYNSNMIATCFAMQKKMHASMMASFPDIRPSGTKLLLGARPVIGTVNGIKQGYISGALSKQAPAFIRRRYFPSEAALSIEDWSAKIDQIAAEAVNVDVQVAAGVPSHLFNLFKDLKERTGVASISELWPSLSCIGYSGTAIENYENSLNELAGRKLNYIGAYIATEAPMGLQIHQQSNKTSDLILNIDDLLFSFTDVNSPSGRMFGVDELKVNGEYLIHTGTPNGLLQYKMNDYIKVTEIKPFLRCQVQGRFGSAMNIATEKVSHAEVLHAVSRTANRTGVPIEHFFVYPAQRHAQKPRYEWVFAVSEPNSQKRESLEKCIDKELMDIALDYREARLDGLHIESSTVHVVPSDIAQHYFKRNSARGQFKPKTSFDSDKDFYAFCKREFPEILPFLAF